ncbi:ABC transporter substrate-binding protein [Ruania alba]|uniref:Raffinose/stachyose/melibiose transport system substrate-binding protein n=1 Tax=Ruania alba TaxID=648782 RepID=A0A1H5NDM3_9MICO|nr:extracellular solute-binding protein [Ruania alba]SEE99636.1 raffinose/stachyose/melibiose transport system substrate-binding protein [Ruania alba]
MTQRSCRYAATGGSGYRNRRGIVGAASAAALALALAACGGVGEQGGDDTAAVTLELVGNQDQTEPTEALVRAYESENPNVRIETSYLPVDQAQTALRTRLGAGNAPDLFVAWPGNGSAMSTVQLAQAGLLEPISGQEWLDGVPSSLRSLLGHEGEDYLWSAGVTVIGTIYNESVFDEHDIQIPQTWDDLLATCAQLQDIGIAPFALANQTPWVTQLVSYAIAPSVAFGSNPDLAQEMMTGEATFSNSGWRQTLQQYMEMDERGCFNDNANGTTLEQAISMLADGDAAMMVQVSGIYQQVEEVSEGRAEYAMFPFPASGNFEDLRIPAGISSGLVASPTGDHVEVAKDFLSFAGQEEQMEMFAAANSALPFVVEDATSLDPILQPFVPYMENDMAIPFMDQEWPNAEVQPTHFAVIQELFSDAITVDEALEKLDTAYAG